MRLTPPRPSNLIRVMPAQGDWSLRLASTPLADVDVAGVRAAGGRTAPGLRHLMRVAVIGGGVVGLTLAWRLAADGHRVDLYDDRPGSGASHAAAGMLSPAGEAWFGEDALLRLGAESLRMWPAFAEELSRAGTLDVWLRRTGTLLVGCDDADAADLDRTRGLLRRHGLAAEPLTRREARAREPALSSAVRRGLLVDDLSVHNRRVVEALRRACARSGVRLHRQRADVVVAVGAAVGVRGRGPGRLTRAADAVVVAAGTGLREVRGVPERIRAAVRPVKGQILRLHGDPPPITRTVRALVRGDPVYAVPRADGEVVLGATSEDREDGRRVSADGVFEMLRRGIAVLPALRECALTETTARARPGTADNGPLVGHTGVDDLFVAAGHYRGGVLTAPVTAQAVADLLHGRPVPEPVRAFTPDRLVRTGAGAGR
jgi:glycine oxidase